MVLIELVILIAGVCIVIITVIAIIANPNGPPVTGPCRLVTRTIRKDYCSGNCPGGQTCIVTATRPWAWGIGGATQAAACACGTVVGIPPAGSVPGAPSPPPSGGDAGIAPITGSTHH